MLNSKIRILAAIMFSDLVGYTALMQENEAYAKEVRDIHRKILEDIIFEHKGNIVQYYGDGTLSIFGSIIEAAKAAAKIQLELKKYPKIGLKIAIHAGDVVYDDDGIYGDSVNVASRIQGLGIAGSVLISEKVVDEIRNQPEIPYTYLGEFKFKNVQNLMKVYAIAADYLSVPKREELPTTVTGEVKSIAVLPFINMSSDKDNEYFSDGITEELLNAMTKIEGLKVTSRTSSFAFKNKETDIKSIAKTLDVIYVLEGSVRKAGNRVRITAQLINTIDDSHVWSEVYDRSLEDIFEVQDDIASKIAAKLEQHLGRKQPVKQVAVHQPKNIQNYNYYLQGLYYWNKWEPVSCNKALELFKKVIDAEPDFPLAYSSLSYCYVFLGAYGLIPSSEAFQNSLFYAERAIKLDPDQPMALLSLAMVELMFKWNWDSARDYFLRALKLNPNMAGVHHTYSYYLNVMGQFNEALEECERAQELDPLSLPINSSLGDIYQALGMLDAAMAQFNHVLELDPTFLSAKVNIALTQLLKGDEANALSTLEEVYVTSNKQPQILGVLSYAYAASGYKAKAKELLEIALESDRSGNRNLNLAVIYLGLEDYDSMFKSLYKAFDERETSIIFIKSVPFFNKFGKDSRFKDLLKKLNLS